MKWPLWGSAARTLTITGMVESATSSSTGPLILGHELSGRIVAVGEEVPESRIGERVAIEPQKNCRRCRECRAGRYNLCPNMEFYATPPIDGAFAQYCVIRTEFAHRVPDSISNEAAALLEPLVGGDYHNAQGRGDSWVEHADRRRGTDRDHLRPNRTCLRRRGDHRHRPGTRSAGSGHCATAPPECIDPRETDVATAGLDVNAFVDATGAPPAVVAGIKAVRPAGTAVLVGLGVSEMTLPVEHIQNLEITVTGIFRYTDTWPAAIHLVASGAIELDSLVTGRFGLERADEALESDKDPSSLKSVVYPNGYDGDGNS